MTGSGVILYDEQPGTNIIVPTLGAENIGRLVPIGIIPLEVGTSWKARLAAGEEVTVSLLVDAISETRETWNIIAETKQGDPNNVVMLGAHLDSVQKGAGINDDGSGTAALLEIMTAVRRYDSFPNKIRFAWWGAEESGLVGSLYYTSHLTEAEADSIKYYFNYDMIGSPQPDFSIASNANSGVGPQLLEEYLVAQGVEVRHGYVQLVIPKALCSARTDFSFPADSAPAPTSSASSSSAYPLHRCTRAPARHTTRATTRLAMTSTTSTGARSQSTPKPPPEQPRGWPTRSRAYRRVKRQARTAVHVAEWRRASGGGRPWLRRRARGTRARIRGRRFGCELARLWLLNDGDMEEEGGGARRMGMGVNRRRGVVLSFNTGMYCGRESRGGSDGAWKWLSLPTRRHRRQRLKISPQLDTRDMSSVFWIQFPQEVKATRGA
jgi:hypothetical protein